MTRVWFTADTHFGHKKIAYYASRRFCLDDGEQKILDTIRHNRSMSPDLAPGWAAVSRMDDHLIRQVNEHVRKEDILWHLGDFCWGRRGYAEETARKYRERINCRNVFLVAGNHDSPGVRSVFSECHDMRELKIGPKQIVLCHYAQAFWNRSHSKSWMLYGHAHGSAEEWMDQNMPGRLSMDVGVDNVFRLLGEYRPISFEEISSIFSSRKGFHIDGNKIRSALHP
jgi:calcineurin-like phosphoesterase family protein